VAVRHSARCFTDQIRRRPINLQRDLWTFALGNILEFSPHDSISHSIAVVTVEVTSRSMLNQIHPQSNVLGPKAVPLGGRNRIVAEKGGL
jgi:hypothetical protein